MNNEERSFEQQSKALLNADLQQRQSMLDTDIDRARRLRNAKPKQRSFSWRPAYGLAAAALAAVVAIPLFLSPGNQVDTQLAVTDTELLDDLDLALWLADADIAALEIPTQ